jgi:hypothetical protein
MEKASVLMRWLAFVGGLFTFWCLMFFVCPAINRAFPAMQQIARVIDEYNLRTGMFFYTDVEITGDSSVETSSTIRYRPHGGGRARSSVTELTPIGIK